MAIDNKLTPKDKLAAGRLRACELMPYFRTAIWKLVVVWVPEGTLKTFGVLPNGVMLVDLWCLKKWGVEEVADTILHEVGHLLRDHADRCTKLMQTKFITAGVSELDFRKCWNAAADREINDDLLAAARLKEGEWLLPKDLKMDNGLTAEQYLHEEIKQAKARSAAQQPQGGKPGQKGQPGKGQPQPGPGGAGAPGDGIPEHAGHCGSGAGHALPNEPAIAEEAKAKGRSPGEIHNLKQQVAQAIQDAASKGRGTVPAGWLRWAEEQLKPPKIDWRSHLARACRQAVAYRPGAIDYRYHRPSRRQGAIGWGLNNPIMPALVHPVPHVGIGIDTSGSMGRGELETAVSESFGILNAIGAEVDFVACDAAVHATKKVRTIKDLCDALKGGGGTDFHPVFEAVSKMRPRPEVFVFITDGQGPAPATPPPGVHVIWLLVGKYRCRPHFGSWGDTATEGWGQFIEADDLSDEEAA